MDSTSIELLCREDAFEHPTGNFDLRETHISWIILCGDYAYKLKKPVDFGFLDFSTVDKRRHFCEEELRLNRRFSPELYLAVVPVTQGVNGPVMDGPGAPLDYAVKMRRFEDEQLLDSIAEHHGLDNTLVRSIARELARLHDELPPCFPEPLGTEAGTPAVLKEALEQNVQQISQYPLLDEDQHQLGDVERWTAEQYQTLLPVMLRRIRDGWIIDGHGDNHLGNMAVIDGAVRLFDCIEFNAGFRIIDSIAEIALLAMDLEARGHPAESHRLLSDYLEYRGDYAGLRLLDLYRSYYAMVRAKVSLLRETPDHPGLTTSSAYREAQRYLGLAHRYCQPQDCYLAITHGVSGTGKSTVAAKIVEASGAVRIRSDVERKRLVGLAPEQDSPPGDETGLYSRHMSRKTFLKLEELAAMVIEAGFPVIVDGTFLHRKVREPFRDLARRLQVPFVILDCIADPDEIRRRLAAREEEGQDVSEAGIHVMEQQLEHLEPLMGAELASRVAVDSSRAADELWEALTRQMVLAVEPVNTP
jgi:aminoglycoside phosphotransferase family enzyme/predicted kinase